MSLAYDVLIVGGGHGGAQAAIALRQRGFEGSIAIVGDEPHPPYERPPLSKDYLSGEKPFERILIRQPAFWEERQVALLLGRRVVSVDAGARTVSTADGQAIGYGDLVWAAGGTPQRLTCTGHDVAGVHSIRTRADVDRLIEALPYTGEVVVIGGGYIGLEAAAVLLKLGKQVTLVEAQDRVLSRVAGEPLSRFFEDLHRRKGVDLRLGVGVDCITERDGRACGVLLSDGTSLPAEMVIVGIGISAAMDPLQAAGADCANGVKVDGQCRTSLPHVYAIGDCALHANAFAGGAWVRLESVQNATDQAGIAAGAILGGSDAYHAVPWFWSIQYEVKLQTVGLSGGHDDIVVRGDRQAGAFSLVYLKGGRVIALDCVNAVKDYVQGRSLVLAGVAPDLATLADPAVPLKSLA